MTNKVRQGRTLTYYNSTSATVTSGSVVAMGDIVGVAETDIAPDDSGAVAVDDVYELPAGAGAWVQGDQLFLRTDGKFYTTTASGAIQAGVAAADKTTAATTGEVLLRGGR